MNDYLIARYGDPCAGCSYRWDIVDAAARSIVTSSPSRYRALLEGATGTERIPELRWSVTEYVVHLADNNRIWSERIVAAALGAPDVRPYDENDLAAARGYEDMSFRAALWSLERSVGDWEAACAVGDPAGVVLSHPEQGDLTSAQVGTILGHEAHHHSRDLERILVGSR